MLIVLLHYVLLRLYLLRQRLCRRNSLQLHLHLLRRWPLQR
jgi:hypothetical protein